MNDNVRRVLVNTLRSALFILIPIATIALVALAQGYRLDLTTGRVVTGGLVQLASTPRGAAISIDGEALGETTPERLVLAAGEYEITLTRDGWRQWHKRVNILPTEVTWIQYPILLPGSIVTETNRTPVDLTRFVGSPDRKFIAFVHHDSSGPKVEILETNQPAAAARLAYRLPANLRGRAAISRLQWADDSEHLLVTLKLKDARRHVLVDAVGDDESVDITGELRLPLTDLRFDKKNWRELYWLSPEGLRRIDLAGGTVSAVLADNVIDYTVTAEGIFMLRRTDNRLGVYQLARDGRLLTIKDDFHPGHDLAGITYLDYDGTRHIAVINRTQQQVTLISQVTRGPVESRDFGFAATDLVVSPEQRYLLVRAGNDFATYDLELGRLNRFSLRQEQVGPLSWHDEYHLLTVADGSVIMFEFDGGNQENIADAQAGFTPHSSEDGKLIYSVGRSSVTSDQLINVSRIIE